MSVFVARKPILPLLFDPVFSNNTWENIVIACHMNEVPSTWNVGDQKEMTINGVDYLIDIVGRYHDFYSDGSGRAPLTFQLHDLYGTEYKMKNESTGKCDWETSLMRTTYLPEILSLMPIEVQNGIRKVDKNTATENASSITKTTSDDLFLLSEIEVYGSNYFATGNEGSQYSYYLTNSLIKNRNGTADMWWLRSPSRAAVIYFCGIDKLGQVGTNMDPTEQHAISFAFCF